MKSGKEIMADGHGNSKNSKLDMYWSWWLVAIGSWVFNCEVQYTCAQQIQSRPQTPSVRECRHWPAIFSLRMLLTIFIISIFISLITSSICSWAKKILHCLWANFKFLYEEFSVNIIKLAPSAIASAMATPTPCCNNLELSYIWSTYKSTQLRTMHIIHWVSISSTGRAWSFSTPANGSSSLTSLATFPSCCSPIFFTIFLRSTIDMWSGVVAGKPRVSRRGATRRFTATAGRPGSTWLSLACLTTKWAKRHFWQIFLVRTQTCKIR